MNRIIANSSRFFTFFRHFTRRKGPKWNYITNGYLVCRSDIFINSITLISCKIHATFIWRLQYQPCIYAIKVFFYTRYVAEISCMTYYSFSWKIKQYSNTFLEHGIKWYISYCVLIFTSGASENFIFNFQNIVGAVCIDVENVIIK